MYTYIQPYILFLGKRVSQTNPSKFDEKVILKHIFLQIILWNKEEKYMILYF